MAINHTWLVQPMISYCRFNITNSMVFDNVTQVCNCILELEAQYVKWPNQGKKEDNFQLTFLIQSIK